MNVQFQHVVVKSKTIMDIETVFKLVGFLLWPFLLAFLCYLFDIKCLLCCARKGNPDVDQKTEN
jgi:hypothetical protein